MTRVLIVDDDPVQLRLTSNVAQRAGFVPVTATGGREALKLLKDDPGIGAVILDLVMPDLDGMAVLETMAREGISIPVIVQTTTSSLETVVTATRQGAIDFIVKPASPERLLVSLRNATRLGTLENAIRQERARHSGNLTAADLVTESPVMDRVLALVAKAARSTIPVLIEGEAGTGKQLAARAIHGMGERSGRPFVSLDCSALPPERLEAELFGRRKGASLAGKFTEAHGGTLFIAEVGELPIDLQARLLRALQHGEITPIGAERPERVNVRVVSATSRRLLNLTKSGSFREDLFYQLNVLPIYMPPLRDRRQDIMPLVEHFAARLAAEAGRRITGLTPDVHDLLARYDWPGNIRQLENTLYRAIVLSETAELTPGDFPQITAHLDGREQALRQGEAGAIPTAPVHIDAPPLLVAAPTTVIPSHFHAENGDVASLADVEKALIVHALEHYSGRMSRAARALGIGRSTLYRKLRDYGLDLGIESDAA